MIALITYKTARCTILKKSMLDSEYRTDEAGASKWP